MPLATSYDLPNYHGELFNLTPSVTPFLSAIGGLTGGEPADAPEFAFNTYDTAAPSQPAILEGAAPVSSHRTRAQRTNITQIFQYGVDISYSKQAFTGQFDQTGLNVNGPNAVMDEHDWQLGLQIEKAARDVNYTFWQGVYQKPVDNTTARRSRGILTAITTNVEDAATAALTSAHVNALLESMWDNYARMGMQVMFSKLFQKQQISAIYGYAPEDRNVGGVNIEAIETDSGRFGMVLDRDGVPDGVIAFVDLSLCYPRFHVIPGKGAFFTEPMAKTKASFESQLYGEIGLEYGPEEWHGKIINLATA